MQYLGKYEIIAELGRGAMGAVYKARDPLIDRLVALKTITGGPSAQTNLLDRFYQEARSAGTLQHPSIVTIYELGHEKNTPFIAMEYLEGDSLDRIIDQHPALPLSVKLGYIVRVCEALAYAHQHNVVHRDIKPGNIMVTKEGVVKVVDFGIARLTDMSMTQPNMMIGSRAYMSPQLYKGERADARSDIWAVGVTLYELLAYKRPFTGDSEAELMFHIIYEKPPDLLGLSQDCTEELAFIVGKMLEKKSDDRFQSMDDLLHALEPLWKAAQQSTVTGLLADCQQLVAANDLQRAQALLRKALHIDVGNSQAKSMLEKVSADLRRTEILPRLKEHLGRGEGFLKSGHLREARSEAEAALGLDSKHEPAQKLLAEVEAAAAKALQLEQKLRLTKQRLAEGALTEAAAALGQALELDGANTQAQELKKQIDEERTRREKRKKLGEVLHRARTLWTELNYEECLSVIGTALKEFPKEPELIKLQETARADQAEQQKQRQMAEVRKLLAQQSFAESRKVLDVLLKVHPQDTAVKNLNALALREEQEQKRQKRLEAELATLRGFLSGGKVKQVVEKGEALLKEYPEEYELKELVAYARGEVAQQEQGKKEQEREKQIQSLLDCERFLQAAEVARKAMQEFPAQDSFRRLAGEADQRQKDQDEREKARREMQRRVREINSKISQDKITDAIDLAQRTMEAMGPDPNVTQLLHGAEDKKKKREEQERQVSALHTLVDKRDHAGATELFNEVLATQILQPNDPRALELQRKIASLESSPQEEEERRPTVPKAVPPMPAPPSPGIAASASASLSGQSGPQAAFSATRMVSSETPSVRTDGPAARRTEFDGSASATRKMPRVAATGASGGTATAAVRPAQASPASPPPLADAAPRAKELPVNWQAKAQVLTQLLPILRRPPVMVGLGAAVLVVVILTAWGMSPSKPRVPDKDLKLREQANQLWQDHQLDQSEQTWRQLAQAKGSLQTEAIQQINQIEQKRTDEQQRFDQGEGLLKDKKDFAGAQQAFQDVIQMNLWRTEDATRELSVAKAASGDNDIRKQEKDLFESAVLLFENKDYEKSRQGFRAVLDLKVPDSLYKTPAEGFLNRIRQSGDEKKLYDTALNDMKAENWTEARDQFQEVAKRRGPMSGDAKKQLDAINKVLQIQDAFGESLRAGNFRNARTQIDGSQSWPKTHERLAKELRAQQQQQFEALRANAQAAEAKSDTAGIQHAQDELHKFQVRTDEASILQACKELDKRLADAYTKAVENTGDRTAFDAAVAHFHQAEAKRDMNQMSHAVAQEFQKIANGTGIYKEQAQIYLNSTIPSALQGMNQNTNKLALPPISCNVGPSPHALPTLAGAVACSQLDQDAPLQWLGNPMVDFPDVASQPGRLPYTLNLIVTVDASGGVKIDKEGDADKDFFKKAKDASKHWKTTVPRSGGKPITVRFPLAITFHH